MSKVVMLVYRKGLQTSMMMYLIELRGDALGIKYLVC